MSPTWQTGQNPSVQRPARGRLRHFVLTVRAPAKSQTLGGRGGRCRTYKNNPRKVSIIAILLLQILQATLLTDQSSPPQSWRRRYIPCPLFNPRTSHYLRQSPSPPPLVPLTTLPTNPLPRRQKHNLAPLPNPLRTHPPPPPTRLHNLVHRPLRLRQIHHRNSPRTTPPAPQPGRLPPRRRQHPLRPQQRPRFQRTRPQRKHPAHRRSGAPIRRLGHDCDHQFH